VPARRSGRNEVRVGVGDVARALRLKQRFPAICDALAAKKFLSEAKIELAGIEGPPSGQSSTVIYVYRLAPAPGAPGADPFYKLRGIFRGLYDDAGGGEAWLRRERENFGGPNAE
jgi:hypothetical protein